MTSAFISRHGDRVRTDGCHIRKTGVNKYTLDLPKTPGPSPHVFVEPEEYRAATVHELSTYSFEIFTFNMLNGYHPGSDLRVRIFYGDEPEVVTLEKAHGKLVLHDVNEKDKVLVQAHAQDFRWMQVERTGLAVSVTPLITRVPPTPVETDIEVVVIRSLGPLRY